MVLEPFPSFKKKHWWYKGVPGIVLLLCRGNLRGWIGLHSPSGFPRGHGQSRPVRDWHQSCKSSHKVDLGGGFKYFLFSSLFGEMIQFDEHIFQMGWFNHQLVLVCLLSRISLAAGWRKRGARRWSGDVSLTGRNAGSFSGRNWLVGGWLFSTNQLT